MSLSQSNSVPKASTDIAQSPQTATVIDRYFTKHIVGKTSFAPHEVCQYVLSLPNHICVVGLTQEHPAVRNGVENVDFRIRKNKDRSEINLSGKSKHGAQHVTSGDVICYVTDMTGVTHTVYSCVRGKLLEVNEKLKEHPELLKFDGKGYVAVILPRCKKDYDTALAEYSFCTADQK